MPENGIHNDRPPAQLRRLQILAATARCLARDGYDRTTIRRIAAELDCAVGSIYRYFGDKRELLFAVTQQAFEPVAQMAEGAVSVERTIHAYQEAAARDPSAYHLMLWLAAGHRPDDPAVAPGARAAPCLPPVVERILNAWTAQLGDEGAARRCWSALHGAIVLGGGVEDALRATLPAPATSEPRRLEIVVSAGATPRPPVAAIAAEPTAALSLSPAAGLLCTA